MLQLVFVRKPVSRSFVQDNLDLFPSHFSAIWIAVCQGTSRSPCPETGSEVCRVQLIYPAPDCLAHLEPDDMYRSHHQARFVRQISSVVFAGCWAIPDQFFGKIRGSSNATRPATRSRRFRAVRIISQPPSEEPTRICGPRSTGQSSLNNHHPLRDGPFKKATRIAHAKIIETQKGMS